MIRFFEEGVQFPLHQPNKTRKWLLQVIKNEGRKAGELNIIFCTDQYLHELNLKYLQHDYFTDIITFDSSESTKDISGDIFVSLERVQDNSQSLVHTFEHELHRVMVHGVLHLLGFGDSSESEKKLIREKEDSCLSLYFN